MSPVWKLAVRILAVTTACVAAGGGAVTLSLIQGAPAPVRPEIFPLIGHSNSINAIAWSPDGRLLVVARTLEVLRLEGEPYALAATHDGDARSRAEPFEALELELTFLWGGR